MRQSFGTLHVFINWLFYPFISRVRHLNPSADRLQELLTDGQVFFVSQGASFVDLLVLNFNLRKQGLEPVRFTHGISPFLVMPFGKAFSYWWTRQFKSDKDLRKLEQARFAEAVADGKNGLIFLKQWTGMLPSRIMFYQGYFGELSNSLRENTRNLWLVPTSVFLTRARKKDQERTLYDVFFRSYDIPGKTRKSLQLLFQHSKGGIVFSEPIDLREEVESQPEMNKTALDKRFRLTLLFHLNNEDRAYRGPNKRSKEQKVRKILEERKLNDELKKLSTSTNRPLETVHREARKILHEIASDTNEGVINVLRMFFDFVWSRTLDGIDFRDEELDKIRSLTKKGPVVILPCHRSHVDYLVVAHRFEKQGLHYPRFAAGDNLSKWPLGGVLRRAGAFFIRRSFKGEAIFPLVFEAYIRHLLRERHVLIFFMEGGRSRTGKLLHPKIGMMSMVVEAWRQGDVRDLPLIPVTIDYGRVFEGDALLRERSGKEKVKENLASVIRSRRVLSKKHGILRLRFADPIYLKDYVEQEGYTAETLGFRAKIPFLHKLSYDILGQINEQVTITAGNVVAAMMLGNPRRGMSLSDLRALFVISVRLLRHRKVELTFAEKKLDIALQNALDTFVDWDILVRVQVGGQVVVNIPEDKRSEIEYYKNNGFHFILDLALFSLALRRLGREERTFENIHTLAIEVYALINQEFLLRGEFPTREMIDKSYRVFERVDALRMDGDLIVQGNYRVGRELVRICANMTRPLLESYFAVADMLASLEPGETPDKKQFLKKCMERADLLYAVGTLYFPESANHVTFGNALEKWNKQKILSLKAGKSPKHKNVVLNPEGREKLIVIRDRLQNLIAEFD